MKPEIRRSILRWIHILFALPLVGFIYGPASEVEKYRPNFRYVFLPAVIVTGLWLWKGLVVRRLFSKRSPARPGE